MSGSDALLHHGPRLKSNPKKIRLKLSDRQGGNCLIYYKIFLDTTYLFLKFLIFLATLLLNKIFKFQICFYNNDNRLILSVVNIRDNWFGFGLFYHMWVYFFSFICIRLESNYCYLKIIPLTNLRLNWLRSNKTHVISNQHPRLGCLVVVGKTHLKFEFLIWFCGV